MATTFRLEIVTPDGMVFEGDVQHVRAPGVEGSFGVLPNHTPFITPLAVGKIEVRNSEGKELLFATSGGLADVHSAGFTLIAETAELAEKIDLERAKAAKERAERRIVDAGQETDLIRARAAMMRASNRLTIGQR